MKIGAVSMGWGNVQLQTIFQQLSEMGGECVELNDKPGRHAGLILHDAIPQVRQWASDAGIEISGISGYCDFAQTTKDALQRESELLLNSVHVAAQLDVAIVRAFVGEPKLDSGMTLDDFWSQIVDAFGAVATEAATEGVTIAIENHGRLLVEGKRLAKLVEEVGAPNLGITLDSGNFGYAGRSREECQQDIVAVLPHTVNVHIKDGLWQDGSFPFVPAGEGELDLVGLLQMLNEAGYSGAICSEFEGTGDFYKSTRQSIIYLKSLRSSV